MFKSAPRKSAWEALKSLKNRGARPPQRTLRKAVRKTCRQLLSDFDDPHPGCHIPRNPPHCVVLGLGLWGCGNNNGNDNGNITIIISNSIPYIHMPSFTGSRVVSVNTPGVYIAKTVGVNLTPKTSAQRMRAVRSVLPRYFAG